MHVLHIELFMIWFEYLVLRFIHLYFKTLQCKILKKKRFLSVDLWF